MHRQRSKALIAYENNRAFVSVLCMTWQDMYDRSLHGKGEQTKVSLPVANFIHVDPWYDRELMSIEENKKFRKLIDACSKTGTKILIWGSFMGLQPWVAMLQGQFNKNAQTKWEVEHTPLVVVRQSERNRRAYRGLTFRSHTEFAILATRVDPGKGKKKTRDLDTANNTAQVMALELPTAGVPKLSDHSNVIMEYKPPTQAERLKDAKGKPLRPMAEKSVDLNAQLLSRWTKQGDTILDLFAGTCGMAVSAIGLGGGRKYIGVENDDDIIEEVQNRIGRAHMLIAQQATEASTSLASLIAFQNLASANLSFVMPAHNLPTTLLNGRALANTPQGNLDWEPPRTSSRFEIKETNLMVEGVAMGEGLFLREDESRIDANTEIPELYFFGKFVASSALDSMFPDGVPGFPGVFDLREPIAAYSMVISDHCPAAKINDARGTQALSMCDVVVNTYTW